MRRLPSKGEKCSSPRVTLRIHHLKDKKDKAKVTVPDHDAYDTSGGMEGGKAGSDEVVGSKEGGGGGGEDVEGGENKENSAAEGGLTASEPVEVEVAAPVKRTHSTEEEEDTRKKRRKEDSTSSRGKTGSTSGGSPKSAVGGESENEDNKSVESPGPKVPPLKIVIPGASSLEEQGTRNGKNGGGRHNLPYVVSTAEGEGSSPPPGSNATEPENAPALPASAEDQKTHQRVLRSHRSGNGSNGASGNPSPVGETAASPRQVSPTPASDAPAGADLPGPEEKPPALVEEVIPVASTAATAPTVSPPQTTPAGAVELHPRKRKLKPKDLPPSQDNHPPTPPAPPPPPDQQVTNCYQLYLNIRKQIDRRRKGLFPVQPKPPQGFKDYLMNRCTYVLAGNPNNRVPPPHTTPPASIAPTMRDTFMSQEKDRYRLRMQHVIEKEKLVLSVEQEILRVHGRAARALANQALPFSACTILRDEEVYSPFTPEQEEKDRNARSRYNGRLFLSWLQDVDDKWEKIKETMLLRHHNEAESLFAVQRMDWEWKMKELGLCENKAKPIIEEGHVPMVHVSDDFDLLPA